MTSAYMFFVKDQHSIVSKQNPGLKMTEISGILGKKWKNMSEEEKETYQDQANKAPKVPRKAKLEKQVSSQKPKRGLNAYMKFAQQQRSNVLSQDSALKITEVSKKLGEMWRKLSDEEKLQYK